MSGFLGNILVESIDLPSVKEENVSDDEGVNQLSKPFEEYYYEDDNHYENATSFVLEMCEEKGPLCRICACSSTQLIDIFSMQGRKMQILKKIHIHLPIMVIEQDVLPTYICPDCINTLDRCHSFIIKCLEADVQLKRIHGLEELIEEESERKGAKFSLNDVLKTMILHWRLMIDTSEAPAPSSDNDNNEASDEEEDGNAENYAHSDSENNEDTETGEEIAEQDIETKNITQNATELDTGSEMVVIKQPKVMTVDVLNPRTGLNEKVSVLDTTVDAAKKVFCCCKACDVMFSSLVGFVSHQIRVHNVKMFSCSSCSTILNTSDASFIQHLSTCEKKKPGNIPTGDLSSKQQSRSIGSSKTGKFSKQLDDVERFLSRLPTDKENLETGGKVEIIEMSDNKRNMESGEVSEFMSKGNVGKPDIRGSKNKEKISSLKNKLKTNEMERKAITYFSCSLCKKKFIRRRQFMLHCKTEHSGASVPCVVLKHYPCNLCKVNFASYEKLKSHKEKHFSVKGAFNCADCGKLCTTKLSIINHLKKHQAVTTDAEKKHLCEVCGKECKDQKALKYHQETHSEQDYICDICGKTVKHIKQHRQKHNREKIRYECTICGKSYDRKQSLLDHLRGHGEPNFKCPECPKSFHSSSKLSQHLRQHDEVPRYKCDFCDRRFRRNSHKRLHLKTHNREKTFTCKVCLKVFKSLGEVLVHRKEHTEEEIRRSEMENPARTYICNVCGKIYTNWPNFQYHYQLHTGEKPEHCTICNASFRYKVSLQTHMLTHTGEKPFVCKVCDKSFRSRRTLDQHSKLHSSERPFACGTCGKSFIRRETLEIHMRIHTNERPYACKFCAKAFKQLTDRKRHEERHYRQVNKDVWKYVKVMDNKQAIRKT